MLRISQPIGWFVLAVLVLAGASCSGTPSQKAAYDVFLNKIAQDCKPLVIGSENFGQALVFNGLGVDPDHYATFLGKTSALYYGAMPPDVYRNSLTAFLGSGTYNKPSFDCIIAHLPKE